MHKDNIDIEIRSKTIMNETMQLLSIFILLGKIKFLRSILVN